MKFQDKRQIDINVRKITMLAVRTRNYVYRSEITSGKYSHLYPND